MKRMLLTLMAMVVAVSVQAQVRPQNNHTVSTTLGAGLEYGFEWAFAGQATVIGRIGLVSKDFTLRSALDNFQWSATMSPGVTLEPRYYLLMNWRDRNGKYTEGNSAEFIGVPTTMTFAKETASARWPFRPSWACAGPLPSIGSMSSRQARTCFACPSST